MKNITILTLSCISITSFSYANSIDNLERERAKSLSYVLDNSITSSERLEKLKISKMKLLDLERIAINDKKISKNPSFYTIKAFNDFDLTFLVHSSIEEKNILSLHWLEKIGLTTSNLNETRITRR
jgi:hypothetical protein